MPEEINFSLKQKKIALAQSEHAPIIIELMKDCMEQVPLVDRKSQWNTLVNAVTLEANSDMLRRMVDYLEKIRQGGLLEIKE